MKILAAVLVALVAVQAGAASAQQLGAFTNSLVYSDGQPLFVYGTATPGENLVVRLFAPDGTIAKFDQITADDDGSFNHVLLTWPESSTGFPYGTYTVEVISAVQDGLSKSIDVKFTSSTELVDIPIERRVSTTVFAPETSGINTPMRIFVQTTSDGLLIGGDPSNLLDTTHVHLPSGNVEDLAGSFQTLHQGLYFVDYSPDQLGTYVFHVVTFHQGTVSHGSAATNVLSQDIGGISDQIVRLNTILDETLEELDRLNSEVSEFGSVLETASENIDDSVDSVSSSVANIEEASLQLNSLLFPVIAVISIIVALQIVILARRR
ncbi:hypothetical protein CENSYa_1415 [Cenarchaeum symbiosum A]|uniref:Uncharacterized protein n=1 Tax=Cenarchaeum symbiosum (strain A) TaxID=414004 RepID=A0RXH0_CENSY|nr:hypothetical protein CENSYa_1415 [Cenarchaeum symbiosum A]